MVALSRRAVCLPSSTIPPSCSFPLPAQLTATHNWLHGCHLSSFTLPMYLLHPLTSSHLCQHSSSSFPPSPQLLSRTFSQARKHRTAMGESQGSGCFSACVLNPKTCSSHMRLHSGEKTLWAAELGKQEQTGQFRDVCPGVPSLAHMAFFFPHSHQKLL